MLCLSGIIVKMDRSIVIHQKIVRLPTKPQQWKKLLHLLVGIALYQSHL
jgi:hypothetical protein